MAFYFAAVGSAVGFGNVWRFPTLAFSYGGGAFFIPYLLALFLIGIPILFLEIALGQWVQRGDVSVFAVFHKRMRGVGLTSIVCGFITLTYYSMLIAWTVRALFESGLDSAPWQDEASNSTIAAGYFTDTITGLGSVQKDMNPTKLIGTNVGYALLVQTIIFFCIAFGLKTTGTITFITMGFPIVLLFVFLIAGCSLEGSGKGIEAYIGEWDISTLKGDAWSTAVSQIFFSLSVTFGVMTAYGSHMPRNEPAFMNSCVIAIANSMFSFIAGFAVFAAVGNEAFRTNTAITDIKSGGPSLVFGTWPSVLSKLPGGIHWVRLLFIFLLLLGIDSAFSFQEALITCVRDVTRFKNASKWKIALSIALVNWLLSFLYATDSGLLFLDTIDFYINFLMLLVGFLESFALGWIYDIENQIEKFGKIAVFSYMFANFGSVLFACAFWFGLNDHAVWAGFVALISFYCLFMIVPIYLLKSEKLLMDLAFGNVLTFKKKVEPVIQYVPVAWCFLIKQIIPHVLLFLFVNLAQTKTDKGQSKFGHYEGYPFAPYQILGILTFCFALFIFFSATVVPDAYAVLDSSDEIEKEETTEEKPTFPVEALDNKKEGV